METVGLSQEWHPGWYYSNVFAMIGAILSAFFLSLITLGGEISNVALKRGFFPVCVCLPHCVFTSKSYTERCMCVRVGKQHCTVCCGNHHINGVSLPLIGPQERENILLYQGKNTQLLQYIYNQILKREKRDISLGIWLFLLLRWSNN